MKPALFLSVILGGISGVFTLTVLDGGLLAPASPGSFIAMLAVSPASNYFANILAVLVAATVSFVVSFFVLKTDKSKTDDLEEATQKMQQLKGKESQVAQSLTNGGATAIEEIDPQQVKHIYFACDAGMGSSAMGASLLKKKVKEAGLNVTVSNIAISKLPDDASLVITQEELTPRAKQRVPNAYHVSVDNFLSSPKYDEIIERLKTDVENIK